MKHKEKQTKSKEPTINLETINVECLSTSNNFRDNQPIKMYAVTFKLGSKVISQTRHMTEKEMDSYKKAPSVDKVTNAGKGKGLQDTHFNLKDSYGK